MPYIHIFTADLKVIAMPAYHLLGSGFVIEGERVHDFQNFAVWQNNDWQSSFTAGELLAFPGAFVVVR